MSDSGQKDEMRLEKFPELEEACSRCDGRGSWPKSGPCEYCGGNGVVPTEFGEKVLSLIYHNRVRLFR